MGRVALFHGPVRPLELARFPVPEPRGAEVLVRVACCTLCRSDLHTHAGRRPGPTPAVLGHEITGRVEAFGPDAPRVDTVGLPLEVGDRITWAVAAGCGECFYCARDLPQKCQGLYKYGHEQAPPEQPFVGGLGDHVLLVPGTALFRLPEGLSDRVAAPANCATATAAAVLRAAGDIAGRRVLLLGAGILGVTACAMARVADASAVLVCDPDPANRRRAADFGAGTCLHPDELAEGVAALTEGHGADVVLELAGVRESVEAGLALVRTGGTLILAGTVAPTPAVALDPEGVVRRMLTIRGVHNYHPRDLATALRFLAGPGQGFPFESLVGASYPLDQVEQAFAHAHAHPGSRVAVVPESPGNPN